LAALQKNEPFAQLCRRFKIARSTGYKWLQRFRHHGRAGLLDHSRRPHHSPRQLSRQWRQALPQLRHRHPTWGARKLRARLRQLHPYQRLPSARTLGRWLQRLGLVKPSRRHQRRGPLLPPIRRTIARSPNDVWTIDFKGWFRTTNGQRVEPLTVRDLKSRYLLAIRLLPNQSDRSVRRALYSIFGRYGLPKAIRVDNGPPFGGVGPRGLSRLSVWWRRLAIKVHFGRPAHPEDNAAHEQMHGIYQKEVAAFPARTFRAQQRHSDRWGRDYNLLRPHEALDLRCPAQLYKPSPRPLPRKLQVWTYPPSCSLGRVKSDGRLYWLGRQRFIGRAFGGQMLGLKPRRIGVWEVFLGPDSLGLLYQHDRSKSIRPTRLANR
jgi:putative transposase